MVHKNVMMSLTNRSWATIVCPYQSGRWMKPYRKK